MMLNLADIKNATKPNKAGRLKFKRLFQSVAGERM